MDEASFPGRLGERWVVRRRLPDGSATDVIGWVEEIGPERLVLGLGANQVTAIDLGAVIAARRAPAAPGGPDPLRTGAEQLEQIAKTGWMAESEPLGEWTLRAAGGFSGRGNSCLAVGDPGMAFDEAVRAVVAYAQGQRIPARVQVIAGSELEEQFRALGWRDDYAVVDVLVARLASLLGEELPDERVLLSDILRQEWEAAYAQSRPYTVDPRTVRKILDGVPPRAFASVRLGGDVVAIGRGHVSAAWLGLGAIWTRPEQRGHGWAKLTMNALGHWGARRGARNAYLQVDQRNSAAREAYERAGFVLHHTYRYLAPP